MTTKKKKSVRRKPAPAPNKKQKVSPVVRARKILKDHAANQLANALFDRDRAKNKTEKRKAGRRVVAARAAFKRIV